MEDEGEGHEDHKDVHFEIEFEIDDVCQDDEVKYFVLQLICYFLARETHTSTSPSMVWWKKRKVKMR